MANKLYTEIASLSTEELQAKVVEAGEGALRNKLDHAVSSMDNPLKLRIERRQLARIKTELRNRELSEGGGELAAKRDRIRFRRRKNK